MAREWAMQRHKFLGEAAEAPEITISSQTLRRGLLGHVELRVSKKLCKGAGLPIIYEAAEAPEIISGHRAP